MHYLSGTSPWVYVYVYMYVCLSQGAKGNLTARRLPLLTSLILSIPSLCGYIYLTVWQTYM
jgi:hypothetical protein